MIISLVIERRSSVSIIEYNPVTTLYDTYPTSPKPCMKLLIELLNMIKIDITIAYNDKWAVMLQPV